MTRRFFSGTRNSRTSILSEAARRGLGLAGLALAALIPRLFFAWAIPLETGQGGNCAPDELQHLLVVERLAHGDIPIYKDVGVPYAAYFPLSYLPHAAVLRMADALSPAFGSQSPLNGEGTGGRGSVTRLARFARLGSTFLGILTVWVLAAAAELAFGRRWAFWAGGLAAAFLPQFVFIGSYVNGDAMTALAGVLLTLVLVRWAKAGEGKNGLVSLGVAAAFVLLNKPNGFAVLFPTALWISDAVWKKRIPLSQLVLPGLLVLVLAGPGLAWNRQRNGGDIFGSQTLDIHVKKNPSLGPARIASAPLVFTARTFKSSFGMFGNMEIQLPRPFYLVAGLVLAAGLWLQGRRQDWRQKLVFRGGLWVFGVLLTGLVMMVYMSWFVDFQPQGRYILTSVLHLVVVATAVPAGGIHNLSQKRWAGFVIAFLALSTAWGGWLVLTYPYTGF